MNFSVRLNSQRSKKARLAARLGKGSYLLLATLTIICFAASLLLIIVKSNRYGYLLLALSLLISMFCLWYQGDLVQLPIRFPAKYLDDVLPAAVLAKLRDPITPQQLWNTLAKDVNALFITNHLLISPQLISQYLSNEEHDTVAVWQQAMYLLGLESNRLLHGGAIAAALITTSSTALQQLNQQNISTDDVMEVYEWLERILIYEAQPKPFFGGIGRDWTSGFAPNLENFSQNISLTIERGGGYAHFLSHADVLNGITHSLSQGIGVALVGLTGVGKTSLIYGLAERLLEGRDKSLEYYQVVSLHASLILSAGAGRLEELMTTLLGEAIQAGNIIIFLDDAQLFFGNGPGAFDLSQILLPIIQNRRLKLIAALTPHEWQTLRANNEALASHFTPIILTEPTKANTMKISEDTANMLEAQNHILISYEAIREAFRLSGHYIQDQANPGKTIALLEQAVPYAVQQTLTAETIQSSIEKMIGVKVAKADAPEAAVLLHLEDKIHERMINQIRAVNVVADALRRGRAGVANPQRPIGSFLFLGPTGVGKTELARSLAAVYYGNEHQLIRLDMSEYQRPQDLSRILASSSSQEVNLLTSIRQQPFAVVLFDEFEKAHPNILNLCLQLLDEGQLTDESGRPASFRNAIIIATSNAGSIDITKQIQKAGNLDNFERPFLDRLIASGIFKTELINRFDEVVLFRPLNEKELVSVAKLMLKEVNQTLTDKNIRVELTPEALDMMVKAGYDPEFGARSMRRIIQKTVENVVAVKILSGQVTSGGLITLSAQDLAAATAPTD
jgi:ATP-dependent Clp protease ATP-binding subunit ClpC